MIENEGSSYRTFVGPEGLYDVMSAMQFTRLFQLGLREDSTLLEIGAGSLRAGRLLIPFLLPDRYFAVEPEQWLVEEGLKNELGHDILDIKRPRFTHNYEFDLTGLDIPNSKVDFCVAQSIFSHTSLEQMTLAFERVSEVLGGLFLATYMKGDKDYKGKDWVYPRCVTFTKDTVERIASQHGLLIKEMSWVHPNQQTWVVLSKNRDALNAVQESSEPFVQQYVETIENLKHRLNRIERFPPVRIYRKVQRLPRRFLNRENRS